MPPIAESGFAFDPAEALRVYNPGLIHDKTLRKNTVRIMLKQDMLPEGGMIGKQTPRKQLAFAKMPPASVLSPEDAAVTPNRERKKQLIAEIGDSLTFIQCLLYEVVC